MADRWVLIVALLIGGPLCSQMVSCMRWELSQEKAIEQAHVAAGQCRNGWGLWETCK